MADKKAGVRPIVTLLRLAGRKLLRRARQPADPAEFEAAIGQLALDPAVAREVRETRLLRLGAGEEDWVATGIEVTAGEELTVLAAGTFWASKALDLRFGPRMGVWFKVGSRGKIFKTPNDAATLRMSESGPLFMAAKPPGEWADEYGRFDPEHPRAGLTGSYSVCLFVWRASAHRGLEALLRRGDWHGLVANALVNAQSPVETPAGWQYLWRLGQGDIYRHVQGEHGTHIHCHTHEDVGILQYPADFPLTDKTRLRWRWKADKLPSDLAEGIQPTHDYLSIAVEFDNGQDLTYMWSGSLAPDTIFRCPLPFWDKVETHWVLRSRRSELGRWLAEERPVRADYARAVGAPPSRIVRVWLIAVSVFQRGEGICEYADIELVDDERVLKIA